MISFPRWGSTAKEYSTGNTNYSGRDHAVIGGSTDGSNYNDNSFQGIENCYHYN